MPSRKFRLEAGGPERVVLSWRGIWKDVTVSCDDVVLGQLPNLAALKRGATFTLPDGGALRVQFGSGPFNRSGLQVARNGAPLAGSGDDPRVLVKLAATVVALVGVLSATFGALGAAHVAFFERLGFGWPSAAFGAGFLALAWLVQMKRSRVALGIAVGLYGVDTVLTLVTAFQPGMNPPFTAIFMRIIFFMPMIRGFAAIKAASDADQADAAVRAF